MYYLATHNKACLLASSRISNIYWLTPKIISYELNMFISKIGVLKTCKLFENIGWKGEPFCLSFLADTLPGASGLTGDFA